MSDTGRLPLPPADEPTTSYEGTGTFRPAPAVPSAVGPGVEPSADFRTLLRSRWTTMAVIGLCLSVVVTAIVTPMHIREGKWGALAYFWLLIAIPATVLVVLRSRPTISLRTLRAGELIVLGLLAGAHIYHTHLSLGRRREGAVFAGLSEVGVYLPPYNHTEGFRIMVILASWYSLWWLALLVGYGLLVPNTWKRATVIVSVLAFISVAVNGTICWQDPDISRENAFWFMLMIVGSMAVAVAAVCFCAHGMETLRQEVVAARRLGQYQLKELLGRGGMGEVYRAEHLLLRRPCAIKLIRPERAGDPANLRRFEREVQATATLTNWHSVEIFDYGHAADGTFYYVMEYLPGLTLDQLVTRHGPLPPARAVHLLRQVCVALREAHGIGLIHRDIKPSNIIVGERGGLPDVAKLLDFGLVRPAGPDGQDDKLTQTGALVGTPAYMSPEQAGGEEDLGVQSDIYSLGAVAYFLLTGRPPFVGKTALQVLAAHLREGVRPLTDLRPDCPADLQAVVLGCLEKKPEDRFADIDHLEQALGRCACAGQWDREKAAAWWRQITDASAKRRQ